MFNPAAAGEPNFDVTANGRFLIRCDPDDFPQTITVVVNWQNKLR
jgi:hypothetical protein